MRAMKHCIATAMRTRRDAAGTPQRRGCCAAAVAALVCCMSAAPANLGRAPSAFAHPARGTGEAQALSTAATAVRKGTDSVALRAFTSAPVAEPPEDLMTIKQRPFTPSAEHLEYAVVEYSGRQHMVTEGSMYETHFIRAIPGAKVRLNRVLLLKRKGPDGKFEVSVGQPLVDGAYCEITILEHLKSDEQIVFKHKKKKHYMKRYMVQQKLTRFRLDRIVMGEPEAEIPGKRPFPLWDKLPPAA